MWFELGIFVWVSVTKSFELQRVYWVKNRYHRAKLFTEQPHEIVHVYSRCYAVKPQMYLVLTEVAKFGGKWTSCWKRGYVSVRSKIECWLVRSNRDFWGEPVSPLDWFDRKLTVSPVPKSREKRQNNHTRFFPCRKRFFLYFFPKFGVFYFKGAQSRLTGLKSLAKLFNFVVL